jgi:hypothetical protein
MKTLTITRQDIDTKYTLEHTQAGDVMLTVKTCRTGTYSAVHYIPLIVALRLIHTITKAGGRIIY